MKSEKEIAEIIHEAITKWDYNPATKTFAKLLAKAIVSEV